MGSWQQELEKLKSDEKFNKEINYTTIKREIVSTVAYLIGIEKARFDGDSPFLQNTYEALHKSKAARIIRNACRLRTCLERGYVHINQGMREGKSLGLMPEYVPYEIITELTADGIKLGTHHEPSSYILNCNKVIQERIENCKDFFPNWLEWSYVKDLFIMPNGLTQAGVRAAAAVYYENKNRLPYCAYMNIEPGKDDGNILYSDVHFVTLLYEINGDFFDDTSKITGVGLESRYRLDTFLKDAEKLVIVVDGENSDPYKLCAMLRELTDEERRSIEKILVFDDVFASSAWANLEKYAGGIPVDRHLVKRLKEDKSLMDHYLIAEVCQEFYENNVDSFILLSSDSDFWALIDSLKAANFMLMPERGVVAYVMRDVMKKHNVPFCYLDDYYTGDLDDIVTDTLLADAEKELDEALNLNINELMSKIIRSTRSELTDPEKQRFIEKHLKTMKLQIDPEGNVRLEMKRS